jgi:hypothetical protein
MNCLPFLPDAFMLININKLMYPLVEISSPPPTQHAVKHFQCISWHWELTQTTTDVLYEFAQR